MEQFLLRIIAKEELFFCPLSSPLYINEQREVQPYIINTTFEILLYERHLLLTFYHLLLSYTSKGVLCLILMIDNYDSFTYNLVQYLKCLNEQVMVYRNDQISLRDIEKLNPGMIVLSPGPCTPNEAGICKEAVESFKGKIPILGICLGHQTIGQVFGGKIVRAREPVHGKVHPINHTGQGVFKGLKNPLNVTRYHSLVIEKESLPECLEITAQTLEGEIMGISHRAYTIEGVQFHPEAILTEKGMELLNNFLLRAKTQRSK